MIASARGDTIIFEADTLARYALSSVEFLAGGKVREVQEPERWVLFFYIHSPARVTTVVCASCAADSTVDWPAVERDFRLSAFGPKGWIPLRRFDRVYWSRSECCGAAVDGATRYTVYWVGYGIGPNAAREASTLSQSEAQYERDVTLKPNARLIGAALVDVAQTPGHRRSISLLSSTQA